MTPIFRGLAARLGLVLLVLVGASACASRPSHNPSDPLEPFNRQVFAFNNAVDRHVAKPVAQAYVDVVPRPARRGFRNFLANLGYPVVIVNDLLQAKWLQATRDTGRFLFNTTVGLAGFLDPASDIGLTRNNEDLGQTLGYWGVGEGWFLMLPFLGPSTNRDFVGGLGDAYLTPQYHANVSERRAILLGLTGLEVVETRAALLGTERLLEQQFDPYIFLRSAYLDRRQQLIYDGNPPVEEIDYDAYE